MCPIGAVTAETFNAWPEPYCCDVGCGRKRTLWIGCFEVGFRLPGPQSFARLKRFHAIHDLVEHTNMRAGKRRQPCRRSGATAASTIFLCSVSRMLFFQTWRGATRW